METSTQRTAWHVLFVAGLAEYGDPGCDVQSEVTLSKEPLRPDVVVVRRRDGARAASAARTLRALWPLVNGTAVIEFKSPSRPLRPGELAKLFGYGGQYHALHADAITSSEDLLLVLVVPGITPTLLSELRSLRLETVQISPGYLRADGRPYDLVAVDLSAVVEADRDELMAIFVRGKMLSLFATRFMERHRMTPNAPRDLAELEDYHDVVQRWLSALTPAERLEGLSSEQLVLALPDDVLRGLSDEYVRSLPTDVANQVRRRIGRAA